MLKTKGSKILMDLDAETSANEYCYFVIYCTFPDN